VWEKIDHVVYLMEERKGQFGEEYQKGQSVVVILAAGKKNQGGEQWGLGGVN